MIKHFLTFSFLFLSLTWVHAQTVVYVDQNATGNDDGTTWTDAYTNLDTALSRYDYLSVDEIWVAEGTYTPGDGSDRSASFGTNPDVTRPNLYGGFNGTETERGQRDPRLHETILSGDLQGNDNGNLSLSESTRQDNVYNVVKFGSSGTLDGFVIEGGHANGNPGSSNRQGAAALIVNNDFTLRNCVIRNNVGGDDFGIVFFRAAIGYNNIFWFNRNEVYDNRSSRSIIGGGRPESTRGYVAEISLYNNLFHDNTADSAVLKANQYHINNGGRSNGNFTYMIHNNTFYGNTTTAQEGAPVVVHHQKNPSSGSSNFFDVRIIGNIFWNNASTHPGIFVEDRTSSGGYLARVSRLNLSNNLIEGNDTLYRDSLYVDRFYSFVGQNFYGVYPEFADTAAGDFRTLTCGIPGNDQAPEPQNFPSDYDTDFYGNDRSVGAGIDIGHGEVQEELTGVSVFQESDSLVAMPDTLPRYDWIDNANPRNPVRTSEGGPTFLPTREGSHIMFAYDYRDCAARVDIEVCLSRTIDSVVVFGDSLVAYGQGGDNYLLISETNGQVDVKSSGRFALPYPDLYQVVHLAPGPGCRAKSRKIDYCDAVANTVLTKEADTLRTALDSAYAYTWYRDDQVLPGLDTNAITVTETGTYYVEASINACVGTSNRIQACPGVTVPITNNAGILETDPGFDRYQWYLNGEAIDSADASSYTASEDGRYYVEIETGNCTTTSATLDVTVVGIDDAVTPNPWNLYPNPVAQQLYIRGPFEKLQSVRLYELRGQLVKEYAGSTQSIDVSGLPEGVYWIELQQNQQTHRSRIIKN